MKILKFNYLLEQSSIKKIFSIFDNEKIDIKLVGGCIRDSLLNIETKDIDLAVNSKPHKVIKILKEFNINYDDYAYKYGSITAYIDNNKLQITSLREDINQAGRHTDIMFTSDWKMDAQRRDFTINSIYLSSDGEIQDYFNGLKDLEKRELNFIGNPEDRIKEDYLRIFRYFRFLGCFDEIYNSVNNEKIIESFINHSFNYLSNDIIRNEILKMFKMPFASNCFYEDIKERKKRKWIEITKSHFLKTKFDLGLNKCLNKIEFLVN